MVPGGGTKPLIKLVFLCPNIHPYPLVKRLPLPKYALPCPATPSRKGWTIWWMENAGNESAIGSGYQDGNLVPREMTTRDIIDELARLSSNGVIDIPALGNMND
jgi:hypothetical protein